MDEKTAWFAPKRYGYGASLPVTWQGWSVIAVLVVLVGVTERELHGLARPLALLALFAVFGALIEMKTQGGWRWRWGPGRK